MQITLCGFYCTVKKKTKNGNIQTKHLTSCNPPQAQYWNAVVFLCYLLSDAGVVPLFSQQTVTEKYEFVRSLFCAFVLDLPTAE